MAEEKGTETIRDKNRRIREEAAAYPVITGPRTLFEVETPRARLALTFQHRSRRWTVTALDEQPQVRAA